MAEASYISKQKAAARLDVSTKTIDRLRAAGQLDWIRVGCQVRIPLAALEAYEGAQRPPAQTTAATPSFEELFPIPALDAARAKAGRRRSAAAESITADKAAA
jgi:excisionase family DNA binding protein